MNDSVLISVAEDQLKLGDRVVVRPLTPDGLIDLLGQPDRIVPGKTPAPFGYHNNEAYIYDNLGMHFMRDHKTRMLRTMDVFFRRGGMSVEMGVERFLPIRTFTGVLEFPCGILTCQSTFEDFASQWHGKLKKTFGGFLQGQIGPFKIVFEIGRPADQTRNSKQVVLLNVEVVL